MYNDWLINISSSSSASCKQVIKVYLIGVFEEFYLFQYFHNSVVWGDSERAVYTAYSFIGSELTLMHSIYMLVAMITIPQQSIPTIVTMTLLSIIVIASSLSHHITQRHTITIVTIAIVVAYIGRLPS